MNTVTELEGASILRSLSLRTSAETALANTKQSASLFVVCVSAACNAVTFAFIAARHEPMFLAIIGGVAGAALTFGAFGYGESRRLRRRLEAVLTIYRGNVA